MDLKDKVVLVTGSSQGIGKETVLLFAKEGANVIVTYNSSKKKAEEVFEKCDKLKKSLLIHLDVTDEKSIKECVEKTIDKFGAIDILINNSGFLVWKNLLEQSSKEIENQVNTNVVGLIKMTKAVLPYMKGQVNAGTKDSAKVFGQAKTVGMIINVASRVGKMGVAELSPYCATKFAVRGFTQALKGELPSEIKIFSVNPGLTATRMTNFQGINPSKVAEVILKSAKEEIKPDSLGDIDVVKEVWSSSVADGVFGVKKRIGKFFGGNDKNEMSGG